MLSFYIFIKLFLLSQKQKSKAKKAKKQKQKFEPNCYKFTAVATFLTTDIKFIKNHLELCANIWEIAIISALLNQLNYYRKSTTKESSHIKKVDSDKKYATTDEKR